MAASCPVHKDVLDDYLGDEDGEYEDEAEEGGGEGEFQSTVSKTPPLSEIAWLGVPATIPRR